MITNKSQSAYARGLVEHAAAVTAALDQHSPDVRAFMRANFNLQMYPLSFTQDFAAKLEAFRSNQSGGSMEQNDQQHDEKPTTDQGDGATGDVTNEQAQQLADNGEATPGEPVEEEKTGAPV